MPQIPSLRAENSIHCTGDSTQRSPEREDGEAGSACSCVYGLRHHLHTTEFQREIENFLFFQRLQGKWIDFHPLPIISKVKTRVMEKKSYLGVKATFKV